MTVGELFMSASLIFISLPKHTYSGPPKSSELTVARAAFEVDLLITGEKVGWGGECGGVYSSREFTYFVPAQMQYRWIIFWLGWPMTIEQ